MNISGCIFDMDGTLLDSMYQWRTLGFRYLQEMGQTPPEQLHLLLQSMSFRDMAVYFVEHYSLPHTSDQIMERCLRIMEEFYSSTVCIKPHVISFLKELKAAEVPICLASATDRYMVEKALHTNGLTDFFHKIFTTGEVGIEKHNPEIYYQALAFLKTPKESTFVFEDAPYAIATAKKAGFPVIGIADYSNAGCRGEVIANTDIFVESFAELLPLFPPKTV